LRNLHSFIIGSLIAIAIFIICNCAGYLIVTFMSPVLLAPDTAGAPPGNVAAVNLNKADVVTFKTVTVEPPALVTLLASPTPELLATPMPLLPTVTGAPPIPTATATSQPSPTNTPMAAEPEATATQAMPRETADPTQLEILSHRTYIDTLGWHHIVGEVQNNSDIPMEFVEVIAKLYDESQEVIGTKLTFTTPDVIFPGEKAPFDVITLRPSQWERISEYKLQVKGDIAKDLLNQHLVLLHQNSRIDNGFLYVNGEVQNTGSSAALVKLVITLYDADRNVINTNWSYANLGIIPAEQISPFEVKVSHLSDPNNFSYRIQIEEEAVEIGSELDALK
jgi:hypothetical protein